jgi:hypothetical protein
MHKTGFSGLSPNAYSLSISKGHQLADNFLHFQLETDSVICSGNRLPANGSWQKLAYQY